MSAHEPHSFPINSLLRSPFCIVRGLAQHVPEDGETLKHEGTRLLEIAPSPANVCPVFGQNSCVSFGLNATICAGPVFRNLQRTLDGRGSARRIIDFVDVPQQSICFHPELKSSFACRWYGIRDLGCPSQVFPTRGAIAKLSGLYGADLGVGSKKDFQRFGRRL